MRTPAIIFFLLWPFAVLFWRDGYEVTVETIVPAKYHNVVMPWHLWVYPWGFNGPYKELGPYIRHTSCRTAGMETLADYMQDWPHADFTGARFNCAQRCKFKIEHSDIRVCAKVSQYAATGTRLKEIGI